MSDAPAPARSVWRRFWFPICITAIGTVGMAAIQFYPYPEGAQFPAQMMSFRMGLVAAILAVLLIWHLLFSGLKWSIRLAPFGLIAVFFAFVKIEFSGDMVPILHWRLAKTRVTSLAEQATVSGSKHKSAIELPETPGPADVWNYRGRNRDGVIGGPEIRADWNDNPPEMLWKQPCGEGYAAMVVSGNLAVTIEQRGENEAVVGYETLTGKVLWFHEYPAYFQETMGGNGPRATPTIEADSVLSLGATGELRRLDARTGQLLWRRNILDDAGAKNLKWGMSGSPLLIDDIVVVTPGGADASVAAYDFETGEITWTAGSAKAGYSSPQIGSFTFGEQIVVFDGEGIAGYAVEGRELWRREWKTMEDINVAQPLVLDGDRVLVSSGYGVGSAMLKIERSGGEYRPETLWETKALRSKFSNPVYYDGHVYGLDEGILTCLEAETGKRKWKGGRYGHGQLLLVGGKLLILAESDEVCAVQATPTEHVEIGRFKAIEGKTWNNPTLAGDLLFVRNHREMACFRLERADSPPPRSTE